MYVNAHGSFPLPPELVKSLMAWPSLIEEKNHLVDIRFIYI